MHVTSINPLGRTIDATASVIQAEATFATTIVEHGASYGNAADPSVPAKFAGLIVAINGLDNMHAVMPAGLHRQSPAVRAASLTEMTLALADVAHPGADEGYASSPDVNVGGSIAFGPFDIETFYNETPLITGGDSGTASPDCVALAEDSDYLDSAVSLFATSFSFPSFNITRVLPGGTSPELMATKPKRCSTSTMRTRLHLPPGSRLCEQQPLHLDPEQHYRQQVRRNQYQLWLLRGLLVVLYGTRHTVRASGLPGSVCFCQHRRLGRGGASL